MTQTEILDRVAGRVILLDDDERVLLFQGFDPKHPEAPWWFTPGGGVDPGETPRDAAARELLEETGLEIAAEKLGDPVFRNYVEFSFNGLLHRQHNHFFMLRVAAFDVSIAGFDEQELETHLGYRWWSAEALRQTAETFFPRELPTLLAEQSSARATLHTDSAIDN